MPIIAVERLTKTFDDLIAVQDISLSVERGECFAFLGPNGAGKTTMIKMLTTLLAPSSGKIVIDGIDVVADPDAARRSFGIVFQDPSIDIELTAQENMEFHAALYGFSLAQCRPRIKELLSMVELWDRRNDLVKHYSGGMRRRLEIARGLLHHPKIFFLDEPTLGLDPQTRNRMWSYVRELNSKEELTVFFTTHYMEEAEREASRIAIIDKGAIIAEGTVREIREKTRQESLEGAFLTLTGHRIRDEESAGLDSARFHMRAWNR